MRRRALGSHGPEVSVVGIGTWAAGGPSLFGWGPQDDADSIAAIRRAIERGVNWVDTAPAYGFGHAEEVAGRAVEPFRVGEEVYVFTKCGRSWEGDGSSGMDFDLRPEAIRAECEASLRRLGVERIDLLQFHWPDAVTGTEIEDSWAAMAALIEEGKVRWGGVSNFGVDLLERAARVRHVDSLQPPLNMIARSALDDVIPWCARHGTGVIAYAPMANGLLAGRTTRARIGSIAEDDWRRRSPLFTEPLLSRNLDLADRLASIAADLGVTMPVLSLAWVIEQPGVTCAAAGGRDAAQVEGWTPAGDVALDPATLARIGEAIDASGAFAEPPQPTRPSRS